MHTPRGRLSFIAEYLEEPGVTEATFAASAAFLFDRPSHRIHYPIFDHFDPTLFADFLYNSTIRS